MTWSDVYNLTPEIVVTATALILLVTGLFVGSRVSEATAERVRFVTSAVAITGAAIAFVVLLTLIARTGTGLSLNSGTFVLDRYALYVKALLLLFAALTVLVAHRVEGEFKPHQTEFVALVLLATVGGMFMASAREMIELYVALETLSISLYVMVSFNKRERRSSEAGFKYLVVGAASSAVLLYGLAILYGLTGRTDLAGVAHEIRAAGLNSPALMLATVFVIGGLSFKIAAVPFHQWVPDVYQGAPTPVTAFVSVSSKVAGYGLLIRVLTTALGPVSNQWAVYLAVIAAITMTVGNITALSQTSLKRMLGYSSIAHAGYILTGLVAMSNPNTATLGLGAVLFYLLVYGLTNLTAFGAVEAAEAGLGSDEFSALPGLARRSRGVALVLALSMLSLTGIPPFVGFFAKVFVFLAAVQAGYSWLALVALANSAVSAVYYMRVVRAMYDTEAPAARPLRVGPALWTALGVGVLALLPLVIFTQPLVDNAQRAAAAVLPH